MKRAVMVFVVLMIASVAHADKKSRSVIAAEGWLAAMTDPKAVEPMSYGKDKVLTFQVQSEAKPCKKTSRGRATKQAEIKALKACFVATKALLDEDRLASRDYEAKWLDADQQKWAKTAPKGTTYVAAEYGISGGTTFELVLALGPDYTVIAVWGLYMEQDGE